VPAVRGGRRKEGDKLLMEYTLLKDGDGFEQLYWKEFIENTFPTYEKYWARRIVPLTNRPLNIHFKSSLEIGKLGFSPEDICLAQLHYTILRHLVRSYNILKYLEKHDQSIFDIDYLSEGLFHVTASQDVAFEFLQRLKTPNQYDPWAPTKKMSNTNQDASKEARQKWQKDNNRPLQEIRDYRNHLTHGRMSPSILNPNKIFVPKIENENDYLDWRLITDWNQNTAKQADFDSLDNVLRCAWNDTINYFENQWQKIGL